MAAEAPLLELEAIEKRFGGIRALRGVSFDLRPGEVHALLGENGAGKSTLIKILSGAYRPDSGRIVLEGSETTFASPRQAQAAGIATIYQETSLYPDLSVLENLFMGHQPMKSGRIDWAKMSARAKDLFERLGMELPLRARLGDLGKARAQLVEIAKALLQQARILILDEPTAALTTRDAERLMEVVRGLRAQGVAMIYITHRLEEVFAVADRVTVLRDGEVAGTAKAGEFDSNWLISKMVGRVAGQLFPRNPRPRGKPLLEVRGLSASGLLKGVSFTIHEGEIVGLAGLVGSGRTEVARAIFGLDRREAGEVLLEGKLIPPNPQAAIEKGLAMLPEDRSRQGLILPFSLGKNVTLPLLRLGGWLSGGLEDKVFGEFSRKLDIRPPLAALSASSLSGGNQQKVVIAKWLATRPKVLILDEPTQGVDVGAKAEIHRLMDELVAQGLGILMISSELVEVLGMADRILVMHRGRIAGELSRGATQEDVMRMATGSVGVGA
jgi:rhamnose transport system ATP-binding protein